MAATSPAGTAGEKRYPWPSSQPRWRRRSSCPCVSIPSASTVMSSFWPSETIASRSVSFRMLALDGLTKDRSILMIFGRKSARYESEEYPVPKSSSTMATPRRSRCLITLIVPATSVSATLSVISRRRRFGASPLAVKSPSIIDTRSGSWNWRGGEVDRDIRQAGPSTCSLPGFRLPDGLAQCEGAELEDEIALLCKRYEHVGGYLSPLGVLPAHQRLEADHLARGEIDDGLVMHRDLTGLKRVPKLLDESETADRLLVHLGREEHVAAFSLALGFVKGGVGVLDELGAVLARPIDLAAERESASGIAWPRHASTSKGATASSPTRASFNKAPKEVVDKERARNAELHDEIVRLEANLAELGDPFLRHLWHYSGMRAA